MATHTTTMGLVRIIMSMATHTPTSATFSQLPFPTCSAACLALLASAGLCMRAAAAQEVVLTPTFSSPTAGKPLPFTLVNHGADTVSICLTNGWSAIGTEGASAFTVERRFGGKWHKVLGKDLRNQLAQPVPAGSTATLAMAGLGEPGTYRLELNYVHGLVPTCWAPHEGKIHVLHTEAFDLQDSAPAHPGTPAGAIPSLQARPQP